VWVQFGDGGDILQGLMDTWGKENGVAVEITAGVDDTAKILAAISAGDPPDLLIVSGPDSIGTWAREKLLLPLDDVIKAQNINLQDIYPGPLKTCNYFGQYYCLPWGTDVYGLFWNKDLFTEAGLDPEKPPETLEELAEYAEKLTKYDADGNITQIGFIPNFAWSHLDAYSLLFGASFYNEDGTQITVNTPEMLAAMKWQADFFHKVGPDKIAKFVGGFGEYDSAQAGFNSGKVAMMIEGEWQPTFIRRNAPNLNYGVAAPPHPAANPERKGTVVVGGTVMAIPAGVKNAELSAKALAYLQGPEPLATFMSQNGNLPTTGTAAKDPRFLEDPKFKVFLDLLAGPNAKSHVFSPVNSELMTVVGEAEENSFRDPAFDIKAFFDEKIPPIQAELDKALGK
jgi:multiple sugar transport system substrate-binding protein